MLTGRYTVEASAAETECEICELYGSAEGLVEHHMNIGAALDKLSSEFVDVMPFQFMQNHHRSFWKWRSECPRAV